MRRLSFGLGTINSGSRGISSITIGKRGWVSVNSKGYINYGILGARFRDKIGSRDSQIPVLVNMFILVCSLLVIIVGITLLIF